MKTFSLTRTLYPRTFMRAIHACYRRIFYPRDFMRAIGINTLTLNFSQNTPVVPPLTRWDHAYNLLYCLSLHYELVLLTLAFPETGSCAGSTTMVWSLNLRNIAP